MAKYKRVLMAVDLLSDNSPVVEKGCEVARENGAELYVIHVIEPLSAAYAIDGLGVQSQVISIEEDIRQASQRKLDLLCADCKSRSGLHLDIPVERRWMGQGKPADEIHKFAKEQDIDLIVLGTHGQSGWQLLLGSTANSVLHGVSCDVLAVRIK